MDKKIIDIYFFSGTGNTFLATETFANVISKQGFSVNILRLEKSDAGKIDRSHMIGIAFPVAISTYPFVWDFIYTLPKTDGTKIFILATMAGGSMGLVGKMKSVLLKKGYIPIGAYQAKMPSNIFFILDEEKNKKTRESGFNGVKMYAERIASGMAVWPSIFFFSDIAYFLYAGIISFWKWKWHQEFFRYKVNELKCVKCGLCAHLCPVENIKSGLNTFTEFGLKCQYCMRCISYCPARAIRSKFQYKNRVYKTTLLPFAHCR
ncbi:4Fe-4S ferredoxin [Candidatus Omnitrophus magneticus]|uniref:4Fe-4S ferredoxin n=1 Tax=Candidatus Omnitrophus magneticus TaxID=1609969 RepID=A0A0F0CRE2_9BACT|nr:4Fe-4S ferredoxin [Candidatus Omnitrophus magneticus]